MSVKEFGKQLARFLKTSGAMRILRSYDLDECGAGGCWILAAALRKSIGEQAKLHYVGSDMGVEHVVVRVGRLYLDQDGAQTADELQRKFRFATFIAPFRRADERRAGSGGTYCPMDAVDELVAALAQRFRRDR